MRSLEIRREKKTRSFHVQIMKNARAEVILTLKVTSAQVMETSINNSHSQDSTQPDDHIPSRYIILLSQKRYWLFIMVNTIILKKHRLSHDVVTWSGLRHFDVWTLLIFFRRWGRLVTHHLMNSKHDVLLWLADFQQLWFAHHFTLFFHLNSTSHIILLSTGDVKIVAISFGVLVGLVLVWIIVRYCRSPKRKIDHPEGWVLCFPGVIAYDCWPSFYSNVWSTVGLSYQKLVSFASCPKRGKVWKCSLADFLKWNHGRSVQKARENDSGRKPVLQRLELVEHEKLTTEIVTDFKLCLITAIQKALTALS